MVSCAPTTHAPPPRTDVASTPSDLARRIEALLMNKAGGEVGLYLERLHEQRDGVLAALGANRVFEPASAIKVILHLHSMLQVLNGSVSLSTRIPWSKESSGGNEPHKGCPLGPKNPASRIVLANALKQMMTISDNRATQAVRAYFGEAGINHTARMLGMNDTLLQHRIGCGEDVRDKNGTVIDLGARWHGNRTTLADLGRLYARVAGAEVLTASNRATFYSLMNNESTSMFFKKVVDEETDTLRVDPTAAAAFKRQMKFAWKTGSYSLSGLEHRSIAGWIQLPSRDGNGERAGPREYVFGFFVDSAAWIAADFDRKATAKELLRGEIRDALDGFAGRDGRRQGRHQAAEDRYRSVTDS